MSAEHTKKVILIGAGPAGLTAAYKLALGGVRTELFEASSEVGGMARSFSLWGHSVDLGPHRFYSKDPRVLALWHSLIGPDCETVNRLTRIYFKGRFLQYPLRFSDVVLKLGLFEATLSALSYLKARVCRTGYNGGSFEDWTVRHFGRRLFEIFFRPYSEKLWGISCKHLHEDFAKQRIKKLSFLEVFKSSLNLSSGQHRSLTEQFLYPKEGNGELYLRMADKFKAAGGIIRTQQAIREVRLSGDAVTGVVTSDGELHECDAVISTMPITLLIESLGAPPEVQSAAARLRFRNTILVYLHVNTTDLFEDQWVYVQSPDLKCGRITNFRRWASTLPGDSGTTVLSVEYWCFDQDEIWRSSDDHLVELATSELTGAGLLPDASVVGGKVIRVKRCYPVYDVGYKEVLKQVTDFIDSIKGLQVVGRYGAFKYNNQDHSILMGLLAAQNILDSQAINLWGINSDSEHYIEEDLANDGAAAY